ncbi:hypothetical protein K3495_g1435 [Podosphaera aphanis]|nr:hypothetical protein K3495_g1435 [Podosphaera aphanis]
MSAQNTAGIQTLLDAEREAQKIVQKAREYRTKRVKEARDKAKSEIDAYKTEKDNEFRRFEAEQTSGNKKAEEDASKEAEIKIAEIRQAGQVGQDEVIQNLLNAVVDVIPVVPQRVIMP